MPAKGQLLATAVVATLIAVFILGMAIYILLTIRNRERAHLVHRERMLTATLEEGERVMNEISKEVHDSVGQVSTLLRMQLYAAQKFSVHEEQASIMASMGLLIDQLIKDAQNISHSLNTDFITTRGLYYIIEEDLERVRRAWKITCNIDLTGDTSRLGPEKQLFIYRIAQEALHNTIKHAQASNINVNMACYPQHFLMCISDNGKGFDPEKQQDPGRLGLANMQHRARQINGQLTIISSPGTGCCVTFKCPVTA